MTKTETDIFTMIKYLKERPSMMLGKIDGFTSYRSFLDGFFYAIDISNGTNYSLELKRFINKIEYAKDISNVSWSTFFDEKYSESNDEEKITVLNNLLKRFSIEKLQNNN